MCTKDARAVATAYDYTNSATNPSHTGTYGTTTLSSGPAGFGLATYTAVDPNPLGALFEGESIACTESGVDDLQAGVPFGMTMWVHVFDTTAEQVLFCDQALIAGAITDRFCLKV